jgi:hypothetical protein
VTATPANLKHVRPPCGIAGFAAAYALLDRIASDVQRGVLIDVVRGLGVQGAAAMEYAAAAAIWLSGCGEYRPPRKVLRPAEFAYIERRVREELAHCNRATFPRMRKLDG